MMTSKATFFTPTTLAEASALRLLKSAALIVGASVFMALCAKVSIPLNFTPVPLTMQPFGVLLIGMVLGGPRAAAAMVLYLLEGAAGLPVFSPAGPGGLLQLLGPTGGFLMASPVAAYVAGRTFSARRTMAGALLGAAAAELVLFATGAAWFMAVMRVSAAETMTMAVLPYVPGEVLKAAAASAIAVRWWSQRK